MELELRDLEIRKVDTEKREFVGLAVPYGETANVGYTERFEAGAFGPVDDVKLFYGHTDPIGKVTAGRDTEEGFEITARISQTPRGDEVYTLMRDGVLNRLSVGFVPVESRTEEDGSVTRTKVDLREVSVVPFPAYAGAEISAVRAENTEVNEANESNERGSIAEPQNTMEIEKYDDSEIRGRLEVFERELAVVKENGVATNVAGSQYRSGGEFLKALSESDETARNEIRAWSPTGNVLADSHTSNDWKNELLVIVNKGRALVSAFSSGPLGAHGNYVEFPKVSGVSGTVAVQANEGDELAQIRVNVTTATAAVKTYGAYSRISRQAIERSDVSYLDTVLKAQANEYGKATNAAVRAAIAGASAQTGASFTLSSATAANFINAVTDGVQKIEDNGTLAQSADFIIVSTDVWQKLANTVDTAGRPVFALNGDGSNTIGNVNVKALSINVAGLQVLRDPLAAAKTMYVASADAVSTWENPGAPIRLDDEDIIRLSKDFSLYGYMAVGVKDANGLVKAQVA